MVAKPDQDVGSDSLQEPTRADQSELASERPDILAWADLDAMELVRRAKRGDPGAVGDILTRLALYLKGQTSLPREHAAFCTESLLELGKTLTAAEDDFRECVLEAAEDLGDDADTWAALRRDIGEGKGPRLPEQGRSPDGESWSQRSSRDQLGRAFCKAFHISRRADTARASGGWMPYRALQNREKKEHVRTPEDYLDKMSTLIHCGESQTQAIKIIRSAVKDPKSATTIRRWMKDVGFRDKIDPKEKERRTLNLGFAVLACVERGMDLEKACSRLARTRVQRACGLPDATVFLRPSTVKAAYELALQHSPQRGVGTDT